MVHHVLLLSLTRGDEAPDEGGRPGRSGTTRQPRVPVLACRDALRTAGATVDLIEAGSDADIDDALSLALSSTPEAKIIVVVEAVGQLRAVVRRLLRRYAPPPSSRPPTLPPDRTVHDLPPIGVLPLVGGGAQLGMGSWLGVPQRAEATAAAVIAGHCRRLDLLRTDAGSVTLDGVVFGAPARSGAASGAPSGVPSDVPSDAASGVPSGTGVVARIVVDDMVLSDGGEPLLGAVIANGSGYATINGLPVLPGADATDGLLDVAVVASATRKRLRRDAPIEVRRARGRAVSVEPASAAGFVDDGVPGELTRRRTWWMERAAMAVYA